MNSLPSPPVNCAVQQIVPVWWGDGAPLVGLWRTPTADVAAKSRVIKSRASEQGSSYAEEGKDAA